MKVSAGTFTGGSGAITINGTLTVDGGTFTSTSGLMTVRGNFSKTGSTFNHNNGTVKFQNETTGQLSISSSSKTSDVDFYNVVLDASDTSATFRVNNMRLKINHSLLMSGDEQLFINGDTILMTGSSTLTLSNTSNTGGGTAKIKFSGSATQSITGNTGTDYTKLPNVVINKSGTLNLSGNIGLGGSAYIHYHAGTISEGTSSFLFYYNDTIKGAMTFYDVEFAGHSSNFYLTDTIFVNHDLKLSGTAYTQVNNGGIKLYNNLSYTNSHSSSVLNTTIQFSNVSAGQSVLGTHSVIMDKLVMNNTGQTLILQKPTTVKYYLVLKNGFIRSDATNLLTLAAGCIVTHASASSFIKGPVKKLGNTSFTFPLGGESSYKPLTISAPSSVSDAFIAEHFASIQPLGLARSGLTYTSMCEYWNLTRTAGSSNVTVTLSWDSYSCDIYTLGTLKIGRWNGAAWADVGTVSTTGSTTSGTITTSSAQSSFGNFLIAKNSPAVTANAGSDATISLGGSTILGGSPVASGGTTPYTYQWMTNYALSNGTLPNPVAKPFSTYQYYLKVTDLDKMVSIDSVRITVNGFDLKSARRFALLADDSIIISESLEVDGAIGSKEFAGNFISPADSVFINTSTVELALKHVDTAIQKIDALSATSTTADLSGVTFTSGVYRISTNASLDGTVILEGDQNSFFVFDINGSFTIADGSAIILDGVSARQLHWSINGDLISDGNAELQGKFLVANNINADTIKGQAILYTLKKLIVNYFPSYPQPIVVVIKDPRPCENFFGYNGQNITKNSIGFGTGKGLTDGPATQLPKLHPDLIRYPAGTIASWWNWKTGWFRGYNNPLFNSDYDPYLQSIAPGGNDSRDFKDAFPLPSFCLDGLPWDNNGATPLPDRLLDLKYLTDGISGFPIFDLNLLTSDKGSQIASLFSAHCLNLPVKYIELGNEFYLNGPETGFLYADGGDYIAAANDWASLIKTYFPNAKVAAIAATTKGDDNTARRNIWNTFINSSNTSEIDALTFHVYPSLEVKDFDKNFISTASTEELQNELLPRIFSRPFEVFEELNSFDAGVDLQKQFVILDELNKEGWITEFNNEDDHLEDFAGSFAHSLYVALLALNFLENEHITHAVCHTMIEDAPKGGLFENVNGFPDGPATVKYEMAASGLGLKYLAMASKNARSARKIDFIADGYNTGADGVTKYPGVYGWLFSSAPATQTLYSFTDSNVAVIVNTLSVIQTIPVDDLFPLGGTYYQIYQDPSNATDIPFALITGSAGDYIESAPASLQEGPTATLVLPPYSITMIRSSLNNVPIAYILKPQIQTSNSTVCPGDEVTIYMSGATEYYITSSSGTTPVIHYNKPTVYATDHPTVTTTYAISALGTFPASSVPEMVTITVGNEPTYTITVSPGAICEGDELEAEVTLYPHHTLFNWYPSVNMFTHGTSDETSEGDNIDLTPFADAEYFVNATDGKCYCNETPVNYTLNADASAGEDVVVCTGTPDNPVILGENLTYQSGATFTWSPTTYLTNLSTNTVFATFNPPATAGDYTYTLTVTGSSCTSSDVVTVKVLNCCSDGGAAYTFNPYSDQYDNLGGGPYLTAYDFVSLVTQADYNDNGTPLSSFDDAGDLTDYSGKILINGPFIINLNLTLENCSDIEFGPDAYIEIMPNCRLIIKGCTLKACGTRMWEGIVIDGNLVNNNGLLISEGTRMQDAVTAVNATRDSRIKIVDSYFWYNYCHLSVSDYRFGLQSLIDNNVFDCTGYVSNMLDDPYVNTRPPVALHFDDVPGTGGENPIITNNTIIEADFGMAAIETGLAAEVNTINNVVAGIYIAGTPPDVVFINNNAIDNYYLGIYMVGVQNEKIVKIINNKIGMSTTSIAPGSTGILDLEFLPGEGEMNIRNNEIAKFGTAGILQYSGGNTLIDNNVIWVDPIAPSSEVFGMYLAGSIGNEVKDNTITGADGSYADRTAIYVSSSSNFNITCNETDNTELGIQFLGPNNNITTGANVLQEHFRAIVLGESGVSSSSLNDQFYDETHTPGNEFIGDGSSTDQFGSTGDAMYAIDYSNPNVNYFSLECDINPYTDPGDFSDDNIGTNTTNGFQLLFNPIGYTDCILCTQIELTGNSEYLNSLDPQIIDNSLEFASEQTACYLFTLKRGLYDKLKKNPALHQSEPYETFFDTTADNNIGSFWKVDSIIGMLTDTTMSLATKNEIKENALDENDRIVPAGDYEVNLKNINEIYLSTIADKTYTFTSEQADDLFDIANQCPFTGGTAVYKARALYYIVSNTTFFDDQSLCTSTPRLADSLESLNNPISYHLYPNPSVNIVVFKYSIVDFTDCQIEVSDVLDRTILRQNLEYGTGELIFNVSQWVGGMYYVKLLSKGELIGMAKLVTVK